MSASTHYTPIAGEGDYDYDLVLLFPYRMSSLLGGQPNKRKFINKMLGLRTETIRANGVSEKIEFVDEARRYLHTDRCFMEYDGMPNAVLAQAAKVISKARTEAQREEARRARRDEMKRVLTQEYVAFTGSDEPCQHEVYCRFICSAIMRRLQQACGLSCDAKYSVDGDEIMVCVRADVGDLRTEADRQNYKLQCKNRPFKPLSVAAVNEVDVLPLYERGNRGVVDQAKEKVRFNIDDSERPELDPGMFRRGWQPVLRHHLDEWRHDENFTHPAGVYFAPYIDVQEDGDDMLPILRHYRDRVGNITHFRTVDRIRLIKHIIGRHINVESMCSGVPGTTTMLDCFALHEQDELARLRREWVFDWKRHPFFGGRPQPLLDIRNYFGEKVALYFAWVEHYTNWLIYPAVVGIVFFVLSKAAVDTKTKDWLLIGFGCFVVVWAAAMTETWKRHNAALNLWWGTTDFDVHEQPRPEFRGELRFSPITDKPEMYHPNVRQQRKRVAVSLALLFVLCLGAMGVTLFCLFMKQYLSHEDRLGTLGPMAGAALLGMWIPSGNTAFRFIGVKLTNWENHRTDTEWDKYLVSKTFLFRFFNSYTSFFYIAFFKKRFENWCVTDAHTGVETCGLCGTKYKPMPCMDELEFTIWVVFGGQLVVGNLVEMSVPWAKYQQRVILDKISHYRARKSHAAQAATAAGGSGGDNTVSSPHANSRVLEHSEIAYEQPEFEAKLEPYIEWKYSFDDYSEMVLQYGYVVLFVSANPLTPLLALVNNCFELHIDAYKLVCLHRRPWPYQAMHIGQWAFFMDMLSSLAVVTNLAVVMIASDDFAEHWGLTPVTQFVLFVAVEHVLLFLKWIVESHIDNVPEWVADLERRHTHIGWKLKGMEQDHDDDLEESAEEIDVTIHPNAFRFARPRRRQARGTDSVLLATVAGGGAGASGAGAVAGAAARGELAAKRITV